MEHLEEDARGPMRQEDIRKMIAQPAIGLLYGVDTVSMASSDAKKTEVIELKMCRRACGHTI